MGLSTAVGDIEVLFMTSTKPIDVALEFRLCPDFGEELGESLLLDGRLGNFTCI